MCLLSLSVSLLGLKPRRWLCTLHPCTCTLPTPHVLIQAFRNGIASAMLSVSRLFRNASNMYDFNISLKTRHNVLLRAESGECYALRGGAAKVSCCACTWAMTCLGTPARPASPRCTECRRAFPIPEWRCSECGAALHQQCLASHDEVCF